MTRMPTLLVRHRKLLPICAVLFVAVLVIGAVQLLKPDSLPAQGDPEPPPIVDAAGDTPGDKTPAVPRELAALQERIQKATRTALPAIVAVKNPAQARQTRPARHESGGSGVIISPDGLVLTSRHVSHLKWTESDPNASHQPGEKTRVILHDGRECEAELLGASRTHDLSLLRLIPPGPYPFVPLDPEVRVRRGDWVLKFGHPLGYRRDRPAPVRLGRVLGRTAEGFYTDCPITGGDSGGPFVDLSGRLVGIVTPSIPRLMPRLLPVPTDDPAVALRSGFFFFPGVACAPIDRQLGPMQAGEILLHQAEYERFDRNLLKAERLPPTEWTQGRQPREALRTAVEPGRGSVVAVLNGEVPVALGTVVGADGWVLTKASELPLQPRCRLPDGRVAEGRVVGAEPAFDLALLKVDAADLRPVAWADSFNPVAGTLLAAPGREELPLAVGIVSVPRRELAAAKVPNHGLPLRVPAEPPEIRGPEHFGTTDPQGGEGGYLVHTSEGLAFSAGIRAGDRVVTFAGRPVRGFDDLAEGVKGRLSGDLVSVALSRDGKTIELLLPLAAGALYHNFRNEDFPIVFEHSVPLFAHESGGPVVDLSGRAVGVTIARVEQHGCLAIPGDVVRRLLPSLQSGKLAGNWHLPAGARVPHSP